MLSAHELGRMDSNQRMPVPKTGALPLGDAPISNSAVAAVARASREEPRAVGESRAVVVAREGRAGVDPPARLDP